jgi:hypothetical protein
MRRTLLALAVCAAAAALAGAQPPKDPPADAPKPPDGWKSVTAKDGTYQFFFPAQTQRSGTRERTFKRGGVNGRSQTNYCTLADGTTLTAEATNLAGPALKGMKINDVYNLLIDADKENGDVTEPTEFAAGKLKGREYFVTFKDQSVRRTVLIVVKGRVYQMAVAGPSKDKTTTATADTFLKSLTVTPKAPASTGDKPAAEPKPPAR